MGSIEMNVGDNAEGREGDSYTNRGTDKGDIFTILADDERASRVLVIQHGSELEDLQILIADVLDSGDDPHIGHRRDLVGWS